jgi:hypothetical protein
LSRSRSSAVGAEGAEEVGARGRGALGFGAPNCVEGANCVDASPD